MKLFKFLTPLVFLTFLAPSLQAQDFQADKNCLAYHVEKTMFLFNDVTVWGTTCEVEAKVTPKDGGVVATVEFAFASIDSKEPSRDETLQGDYLFTEKYPTVTYTSAVISKSDLTALKNGEEITMKGGLTVMALTSEMTFTLKLVDGHLVGKAQDTITRLGVVPPKVAGGMMVKVHDPLEITFDFLVNLVPGAMAALR